MNYKTELLESKAWREVDELKNDFVIDIMTAERLHDIFINLSLSTDSKNQRGIDLHRNALTRVLRGLPVIKKPFLPPAERLGRLLK